MNMTTNSQKIRRLVFAASLASGMLLTGVAASAQGMASQSPATATGTTNVAISSAHVDAKAARRAELDREIAEARRAEFVHFGMSF